jgi:hypothetical protein
MITLCISVSLYNSILSAFEYHRWPSVSFTSNSTYKWRNYFLLSTKLEIPVKLNVLNCNVNTRIPDNLLFWGQSVKTLAVWHVAVYSVSIFRSISVLYHNILNNGCVIYCVTLNSGVTLDTSRNDCPMWHII